MIEARVPGADISMSHCTGCHGAKKAPIATVLLVFDPDHVSDRGGRSILCEECGRDAANAVGFMCIRDGGWSKLEPRKRKPPAESKR